MPFDPEHRCEACGGGPVLRWKEDALDLQGHDWVHKPAIELHLCLNCRDGALKPRPKILKEMD